MFLIRQMTLEIFLEFIRCASENGEEYVDNLVQAGGEELSMAYEMMKKATADEIMREKAIAREKFQRYVYSAIEDGKAVAAEEGMKEGMKKGIEKGEAQKASEIALKMKAKGMSNDEIAEITGLTTERLAELYQHIL